MRSINFSFLFIVTLLLSFSAVAQKSSFSIVTATTKATIVYDNKAPKLDSIAANLLADDIERVTSYRPKLITDISKATGNVIVIGSIRTALIQKFLSNNATLSNKLQGKWECFGLAVIKKPFANISNALVIAGSDTRGTAFGVFTISEKIGVSDWYWWADVPVKKQRELVITQDEYISAPPSIKYRGIFINDEDWGLRPWASNTFEPERKNIGPKTYSKVFELLLRLNANLLWPAMHPGTTPFYNVPGNAETAAAYAIVVGSSHAEPMLRNNVGEWDEKSMGHFNYITNKEKVYNYWEERVKQSKGNDVVYTLGMRGVHDSGMEGIKGPKEAVPLLEQIFNDQRGLIKKHINEDVATVPQVFTAYKEVLDIYDQGLKLPDDVTIVWPDDNYGYIQRLNNEAEKKRPGGSGVYYHASYWGRPHDYLWLGTTHPSLIRQEMMKAYETGADRLWVLNVGDIKPLEYTMQFFFDMAYDVTPFTHIKYTQEHLTNWCEQIFGERESSVVASALWNYYSLAFERRPEFMGWSQTEPTTKTNYTSYNHFYFNDEAERRINSYGILELTARDLRNRVKGDAADALYQLVYYPIICASWMNKKFLYRDKAFLYAKQHRISAYEYAAMSTAMHDSILRETSWFNDKLKNGKWKGMMSMKPRELPVFQSPDLPVISLQNGSVGWDVAPEGYDIAAYNQKAEKKLPQFTDGMQQHYFADIFLKDSIEISWKARTSADWIILSHTSGKLLPIAGKSSQRIWIKIDPKKIRAATNLKGFIEISAGEIAISVGVEASQPSMPNLQGYRNFENNGYVSINASNCSKFTGKDGSTWERSTYWPGTGVMMESRVPSLSAKPDTANLRQNAAYAQYEFYSFSNDTPAVSIFTLPTHPVNKDFSMRYGVSIDDGPVQIVDFKTFGRSEEWKQNVLRNNAIRTIKFAPLGKGKHVLKIYLVDPYVVLDRILINFSNRQEAYGAIRPTIKYY